MIETNFDNCFGPLHCVCRTKIIQEGQSESLFIRSALFIKTGATVYNWNTANFVQWPLLKDVTRELKVHRGTTKLEQFIIIFRGPFTASVCLMITFIYLRMYEKQYCVTAIYCDNCQNHVQVLITESIFSEPAP